MRRFILVVVLCVLLGYCVAQELQQKAAVKLMELQQQGDEQ